MNTTIFQRQQKYKISKRPGEGDPMKTILNKATGKKIIKASILEEYGIDLDTIDKNFDDRIFQIAKEIRLQQANKVQPSSNLSSDFHSSLLETVLSRNPFDNTVETVVFNRLVTKASCAAVLKSSAYSIIEKIAIFSTVVELGAREFFDIHNPSKIVTHLSAAKENGYFFTPASVAIRMVLAALEYKPDAQRVLDPSCGAGVFLAYQMLFNPSVTSITGIELDFDTAQYAYELLSYISNTLEKSKSIEINIINKNYFDYFETKETTELFDLIVMNPPYGSIKFLSSDLTDKSTQARLSSLELEALDAELRQRTREYASNLRIQLKDYGIGKGILEFSKLFLASTQELLDTNGFLTAITPTSWLGDETSSEFRKSLFENNRLFELWIFPEAAKLFKGVNQPTAVSFIGKTSSPKINVSDNLLSVLDIRLNTYDLDMQSLISVSGGKLKFPKCSEIQLPILRQISLQKRFKDNTEIINARGELDITANKEYISSEDTGYRLIRGDHIAGCFLKESSESTKAGYVLFDSFCKKIQNSSRYPCVFKQRIAITQCSYLQKQKRIEAAIVPENSIISNSCNFLYIDSEDNYTEKLIYYWLLINSSVLEWQFRRFSYNNHVSNSEISELICIPYEQQSVFIKELISSINTSTTLVKKQIIEFDAYFAASLGLGEESYAQILNDIGDEDTAIKIKQLRNIYKKMRVQEISGFPNHLMPTLSELDKVMISYVKPGGNWTSIPDTVPSQRLNQIREMARTRGMVRTTYYSRLRSEQPAYTISTYFNRPGNGANIHPWENRTLSSREAARLQSFPDCFIFEGTESEVRTQIGNAVPPLLGYAVGRTIAEKIGENAKFCDLFAGAGGLSYGLELAGFKGIAALELNPAAAKTFAKNHDASIHTIIGDINKPEIQDELISTIRNSISDSEPWVMVGGPPCQGFSTAGYRNEDDIRNKLVFSYLHIIEKLNPTIVVMENVHGILSMSKGAVIKGVYDSLRKLGYSIIPSPWVVNAEMYGVPQMRKRVLIVAAKSETVLPSYPNTLFSACLGRRETEQDRRSFISRYPITVAEALVGLPNLMPIIKDFYPTEKIDLTYSKWCTGQISTEEMLSERAKI